MESNYRASSLSSGNSEENYNNVSINRECKNAMAGFQHAELETSSDMFHLHPDFVHLPMWSYGDFKFEQLGEGFYGTVYKVKIYHSGKELLCRMLCNIWATHLPSGEVLVLKELKCEEYRNLFTEEIRMLCRLLHPNILKCRGLALHNGNICYLAEYISGGSLADMLAKRDPCVTTWMSCLTIAMDIARGMAYVHSKGVVHRDLNSSNILVRFTPDGRTESIIADLGLSCDLPDMAQESNHVPHGPVGSPFHVAPELFRLEPSSKEADVFSFGIILCEMIAQAPGADPDELPRTQDFGVDVKELSELAADCPAEVLNLAVRCCQIDPSLRPPFRDVVKIIDIILDHLQEQDSFDDTLNYCDVSVGELDYVIEHSVVCKCRTNRDRAPSVSSLDVHLTKNRLGSLERTSSRRALRKQLRRCSFCGGRIILLTDDSVSNAEYRLSAPRIASASACNADHSDLGRMSEVSEERTEYEVTGSSAFAGLGSNLAEVELTSNTNTGGSGNGIVSASPVHMSSSPSHTLPVSESVPSVESPFPVPGTFVVSSAQVKWDDSLKRHASFPASLILKRDHGEIHSKTTRLVQSTPGRLHRFFYNVMGRRRNRAKVAELDERKPVIQSGALRKKLSLALNLDSGNENVTFRRKRNASLTPTGCGRSEFFLADVTEHTDGALIRSLGDSDSFRKVHRNSSPPCLFDLAVPLSGQAPVTAVRSADTSLSEDSRHPEVKPPGTRGARKKHSFSLMKYVRKKTSSSTL